MSPYSYNYCVDANQKLVSLQLTFADVDNPEKSQIEITRIGPEGGTCTSELHGDRSFPKLVRIFIDDDNSRIVGFGVMHSETELLKFGAPAN